MTKIAGSGSISQKHGSEDPDPPQIVMDPEHCFKGNLQYSSYNTNMPPKVFFDKTVFVKFKISISFERNIDEPDSTKNS